MATKRIKFLHRKKIVQSDIEIRLEVLGPTKRFSAKFNLGEYNFPPDAHIYVDAKQLMERVRFDFGRVASPNPTVSIDISRLKGERVTFDVLVVDLNNSRKLGAAETVRPTKAGELPNAPTELLPIDASKQLDGVLWRVDYSENWEGAIDAPVLLFDKRVVGESAANFVSNYWVRGLVFAAVMREILTKVLILENHNYEPESSTWRDRWLRFAVKSAGQELPAFSDDDAPVVEYENWIELAVCKMATRAQFLSNLLKEINR